jgi:hypothetical protein
MSQVWVIHRSCWSTMGHVWVTWVTYGSYMGVYGVMYGSYGSTMRPRTSEPSDKWEDTHHTFILLSHPVVIIFFWRCLASSLCWNFSVQDVRRLWRHFLTRLSIKGMYCIICCLIEYERQELLCVTHTRISSLLQIRPESYDHWSCTVLIKECGLVIITYIFTCLCVWFQLCCTWSATFQLLGCRCRCILLLNQSINLSINRPYWQPWWHLYSSLHSHFWRPFFITAALAGLAGLTAHLVSAITLSEHIWNILEIQYGGRKTGYVWNHHKCKLSLLVLQLQIKC